MGGRPPSNRAIDRKAKQWIKLHGDGMPYQWTTKLPVSKSFLSRTKEIMGHDFIGLLRPAKNQVVWRFRTYEELKKFKEKVLNDDIGNDK
jgi:hypothetical protein